MWLINHSFQYYKNVCHGLVLVRPPRPLVEWTNSIIFIYKERFHYILDCYDDLYFVMDSICNNTCEKNSEETKVESRCLWHIASWVCFPSIFFIVISQGFLGIFPYLEISWFPLISFSNLKSLIEHSLTFSMFSCWIFFIF